MVDNIKTIPIVLSRDNWFNLSIDRKNEDGKQEKKIDLKITPSNIIRVIRGTGDYSGWSVDRKTRTKLVRMLEDGLT